VVILLLVVILDAPLEARHEITGALVDGTAAIFVAVLPGKLALGGPDGAFLDLVLFEVGVRIMLVLTFAAVRVTIILHE